MASEMLTFLFTDLEASTRLWEEQPDPMRAALAHHDEMLRVAVEEHAGYVVKSTGDGVLATFGSPAHGVGAAIAAQAALAAAEWPDGLDLRVRMGLHSGEATARDGDWFGSEVNRAARVMSVAHGGQIVCTDVVAEGAREQYTLVDLGEHRLRDLQSAVHLFQIDAPGLPSTFPPLRSLDAYRSNLPYELSSFVGRDHELRSIAERLRSSRVVSIVGVGGVGKTRLALQVASEVLPHYRDGVWLCELARVLDPDDLPDSIAAAVGYVPLPGVSVTDGLPRFLEHKHLLLVLDNCEHLVGAVAAFVTATTTVAARVSVLVTSREALGIRGEHIAPLASLEVPSGSDPASVLGSDAGALFVARADDARGVLTLDETNSQAVHDLCVRLDGIPLAIELAAAQTKMMTPAEVVQRLDKQFRLLTGGQRTNLERHQTLRAAIDWSYDLLSEGERLLLGRLSVCAGGFDLDAAAAIAAGTGADEFDAFDLLGSLVAKSLVERNERGGVTRYRLLEMIRQYASEKLNASGRAEAARDDHAAYYLALATTLFGLTATADDYAALERLDLETANIAAAARWLLAAERVAELMQFFDGLAFLDPFAVPITMLDELGEIAGESIETPDASQLPGFPAACFLAGSRLFFRGDITAYRNVGHLVAQAPEGGSDWGALINVSAVAVLDGDLDLAISLARRAVERARHSSEPARLIWSLGYLAGFQQSRDPEDAMAIANEGLAVARGTHGAVIRLYALVGYMSAARWIDPPRALEAAEECLRIDRTQRRSAANIGRGVCAVARVARGEIAAGLTEWRDVIRSYTDAGERTLLSISLGQLAAALASVEPSIAVELAAIVESDAITHYAVFANPELVPLTEELVSQVDAARAAAATMSYDDATRFVFGTIDRLIAEHASPTIND